MSKNSVTFVPMQTFDASALSGTYAVIDAGGLTKPCIFVSIINDSNVAVTLSLDGATDQIYVPAGDQLDLPMQANRAPAGYVSQFSADTIFYIKAAQAGTGTIAVIGVYNKT